MLRISKGHIAKTKSLRFIGTLDTLIISGKLETGLKIGLVERISELTLYYLNEKLCYRLHFGLNNRKP